MANKTPPDKEGKKPRKEVQPPTIELPEARKQYPTRVADQQKVVEAFRVQSKNVFTASNLRLPDYTIERDGHHLFPFFGGTIRELIQSAKRLGVTVDLSDHSQGESLLDTQCSMGWSLFSPLPIPQGHIRSHMNGYHYRRASLADALMFFIWQMSRGAEPFVTRETKSVHFIEKGINCWVRFEREAQMLKILDDKCEENWCHAALQQISEVMS